jgi:hypothetical protein
MDRREQTGRSKSAMSIACKNLDEVRATIDRLDRAII